MTLRIAVHRMIFHLVLGVILHFILRLVVSCMLFMFVHQYLSTVDKVSARGFNKITYLCCCDKATYTLSYRYEYRQNGLFFVARDKPDDYLGFPYSIKCDVKPRLTNSSYAAQTSTGISWGI